MPPSTRRTHTKSRHGCQQCKRNRTKCDENRPICNRCERLGVSCSLLDPTSTLIVIDKSSVPPRQDTHMMGDQLSNSSKAASPAGSSDKESDQAMKMDVAAQPLISSDELDRLRLMHHYTRETWISIRDLTMGAEEGRAVWQEAVPELALKNDYLLHGLLSISALHLALTDPSMPQKGRIMAVQHYTQGLELFTPHLSNLTEGSADALFAFACLTALYSFGIHLKGHSRLSPLVRIHEVFTMIRGTGIIVGGCFAWLQNGIWGPWFQDGDESSAEILPDEIEHALTRLTARIGTTVSTSTQEEMYTSAISVLRMNFLKAIYHPRTQKALVLLPILGPSELMPMVCIAEPLALAILANWAVILHWLKSLVWIADWGRQTVKAVQEVLPPDWHDCIAWAMEETDKSENLFRLPMLDMRE